MLNDVPQPPPLNPPERFVRPPPRVVAHGTPCMVCKYELGGLRVSGVCPECGLGIGASLRRHQAKRWPEMFAALGLGIGGFVVSAIGVLATMQGQPADPLIPLGFIGLGSTLVASSYLTFARACRDVSGARRSIRALLWCAPISAVAIVGALIAVALDSASGSAAWSALTTVPILGVVGCIGARNIAFTNVYTRLRIVPDAETKRGLLVGNVIVMCITWTLCVVGSFVDLTPRTDLLIIAATIGLGCWLAWTVSWFLILLDLGRAR